MSERPIVYEKMRTPWGCADGATVYCAWAGFVDTPGHGGFKIRADKNRRIPASVRCEAGWYEEDCDWAIPVAIFADELPDLMAAQSRKDCAPYNDGIEMRRRLYGDGVKECTPRSAEDTLAAAMKTLKGWHPDLYESLTGDVIPPGESIIKDERAFYAENGHRMVVVCAWGNAIGVPDGHVAVRARRGGHGPIEGPQNVTGEERTYFIPDEEYRAAGRFYVIDEDRYQPTDWAFHGYRKEAQHVG